MGFVIDVVVTFIGILLGFYGFWLVWRVALPWLPGPADAEDRIAPFACYFTDPFLEPVSRLTRLPTRVLAAAALVGVAAAMVALPG